MIKGGWVIGYDGVEHRLVKDGVVVFDDDRIIHVGKSYQGTVEKRVDARKKLVLPGLINAHTHITNSPLTKSYRGDISNKQFYNSDLYDRTVPLFGPATSIEDAKISAEFSLTELLRTGSTTVIEMGMVNKLGPEDSLGLVEKVGNRAYLLRGYSSGRWTTEDGKRVVYEWKRDGGFSELKKSVEFIKKHDNALDGRVRSMLNPGTVDLCTKELLLETRKIADDMNIRISTHASQAIVEFQEILRRHGMTPIELLESVGLLGPDVIVAHAILLGSHSKIGYPDPDRRDMKLLAKTGTSVAHCPLVFARYGVAMESFYRYLKEGVNLLIGTDTFPQDIIREMAWASIISKIVEGDTTGIATSKDVFNSVTVSAAKALGRDDLGRISEGAKADIIMLPLDSMNMSPVRDPIRNLVNSATGFDVDTVFVDGEMVVENGKLLTVDEMKLVDDLQKAAERVWDKLPGFDPQNRSIDELSPPTFKPW